LGEIDQKCFSGLSCYFSSTDITTATPDPTTKQGIAWNLIYLFYLMVASHTFNAS